jgi:hypothetical protein
MMHSELDTIDHVLRGALNTALLNLQLLAVSSGRDEHADPLIERARAEIRRVAEVVLPAALRIVSLEVKEARRLDLRPLVEQTLAQHALEGVALAPGPWPPVVADAELLSTAIAHLVRNAVEATPAEGRVPQIAVDADAEGAVAIVVRNTWAGTVPPLTTDGLPAVRGHLGGVAAAVRIARLHGGALRYERQDRELVARLSIPDTRSVGLAEGAHRPRAESSREEQSFGHR